MQHASPGHALYVPGAHGLYAPPDQVFWSLLAPPQAPLQAAAPPPQQSSVPHSQPPDAVCDPVGSRPQAGAAQEHKVWSESADEGSV